MNRPPAFQFYPKDFLSDVNVITMTMEERGYYITLISMCWIEGCLKGGFQMVEAFVNQKSSAAKISKCFYEKDGDFYHKRLDEERQKQIEWREKSSQGGKISGEKRRLKGGLRVVEPKGNQKATLQSSSSSSFKSKDYKPQLSEEDIKYAFESLWSYFDKKGSKSNALEKFKKRFKTEKDLSMLEYAVENYLSQWEPDKSWRVKKALEFFLSDKVWTGYIPDDAEERWQQSQLKIAQGA